MCINDVSALTRSTSLEAFLLGVLGFYKILVIAVNDDMMTRTGTIDAESGFADPLNFCMSVSMNTRQ
jgi:hypothetical protein